MSSWAKHRPIGNNTKHVQPVKTRVPTVQTAIHGSINPNAYRDTPISYKLKQSNMKININDLIVSLLIDFEIEPVYPTYSTDYSPYVPTVTEPVQEPVQEPVEEPVQEPVEEPVQALVQEPIILPPPIAFVPPAPIDAVQELIKLPELPIALPIAHHIIPMIQPLVNQIVQVQPNVSIQYIGHQRKTAIYHDPSTGVVSMLRSHRFAKPFH